MASSKNSGGLGLVSILTIIFVVLKLTDNIDWSWWWVLSPLWIGIAIGLFFIIIMHIIGAIVSR